jgi:hypothetical protein
MVLVLFASLFLCLIAGLGLALGWFSLPSLPRCGPNVLTQQILTQTKLSHEAAKYQDNPKDGQQCSGCVQFVAPHSCKVVEDPVAASGWCQLFQAKPA